MRSTLSALAAIGNITTDAVIIIAAAKTAPFIEFATLKRTI
jgi:hypothetical protein